MNDSFEGRPAPGAERHRAPSPKARRGATGQRGRAVIAVALLTGAVAALPTSRPGKSTASAHGAPGRYNEPIVLTGDALADFAGAPPEQLWAYAYDHGDWERVPIQMDERNARGLIVASEDRMLDGNDEVVFTSELMGTRRGADDWPPGIGREHAAAEVRITDPLDTDWEAYVYLFWSPTGPENALVPAVTWDPGAHVLTSAAYSLGFADSSVDGFNGIKSLRLFTGAPDILDRLKIRLDVTFIGMQTMYTEESDVVDLAPPEAVTAGPVRVVLDSAGTMAAYGRRVRLGSGLGDFDPSFPGLLTVNSAMVALDFLPSAGAGTYRDANTQGGVPIDGVADTVASSPWSPWRSVEFVDGRLVMLNQATAGAENAYADGTFAGDTGDMIAHGQTGAQASDLDGLLAASFPGEMVMVGPGQDFAGATLYEQGLQPLDAEVFFAVVPTATGPTPTPSPTESETPVTPTSTLAPSATPTGDATTVVGARLFLPRVLRQR
jgi:hypothetical protein